VAKADGDSPSSDDLKAHADEPKAEEPAAEYADLLSDDLLAGLDATSQEEAAGGLADDVLGESPIVEEGLPEGLGDSVLEALDAAAATETAAEEPTEEAKEEGEEEGVKPPAEKKPFKLPWYLELAAVAVIALILLGIAAMHFLYFSTALYVIALGLIPYGIWKTGETSNVYTVILGCALAAVLTAAYCLWIELERYDLDIKARTAKQRIGMVQGLQFGPANTTAAAWPTSVRLTSSATSFEDRIGSPEIT
jgi:hypothetical protein